VAVSEPVIRWVVESDLAAVVGLVYELAEFERVPQECQLTSEQLGEALFAPEPALFGHVAEVDGTVVGCALWYLNYSTWKGSHGIYLLDLYVQPDHRSRGLGRSLLAALAAESTRRGLTGLEWSVLDWNRRAIAFYQALGAQPVDGWTTFQLTGNALVALSEASAAVD
jgi:GNAT superfamily N-acetyltransferase